MRVLQMIRDVVSEARTEGFFGAMHELRVHLNAGNEKRAEHERLERNYIIRGEQLDKERKLHEAKKKYDESVYAELRQGYDAAMNGWGSTADERDAWKLRFEQLANCGLGPNKGCGSKCLSCCQRQYEGWMERAKKAEADNDGWKRQLDLYVKVWVRELGGKVYPKTHEIDSLALTTERMRRRAEQFESTYALVKKALAQLTAIPPAPDEAAATLKEATR